MFEKERKKFREFIGSGGFLGISSEDGGFLGVNNQENKPVVKNVAPLETPNRFAELNLNIQKRFFRNWR